MELLGGPLFSVAGAGESHGPGISTIVFGCPAGLRIDRKAVQHFLDRRRPGGNKHGTPRNEKDKVLFTAGLFDDNDHEAMLAGPEISVTLDDLSWSTASYEYGFTTGEPISAIVLSTTSKSQHYQQFSGNRGEVRPGHTDLVKHHKSKGFVDYRGGGRSSYRSTISDVVGGSIARLYLQETFGTVFLSSICQVGELKSEKRLADVFADNVFGTEPVAQNQVAEVIASMEAATIHSIDTNFADEAESLKGRLMASLGGLHAVNACEVGAGQEVVSRLGSQNNDSIRSGGYQGNNHGGLLGGITTGKPIVARAAFKPTSTINLKQKSVRKDLSDVDYELSKGRHDPCVGVRAGVTLESRMAIEVMNAVSI